MVTVLKLWQRAYPNSPRLTDDLYSIWEKSLESEGITAAEFARAGNRILKACTFFPTVADAVRVIRPPSDIKGRTAAAWARVGELIRTLSVYATITVEDCGGDSALLWCIAQLGWINLGDSPEPYYRQEFRNLYPEAVAQGYRLEKEIVPGRHEIRNRENGYAPSHPAAVGRRDWPALPPKYYGNLPALPASRALARR